jgi:hypothetical protein
VREAACQSWPFRNLCAVTKGVVSSAAMSAGAERLGNRKCWVCRRPSGLKKYCPICDGLLRRTRKGQRPNMAARRDALHEQWNEDLQAFTCKYTSIVLTHDGGARNAEWEHVIPGVESSVVLVAAVVNRMKGDLTEDQWDAMIGALYALRIQGKPFDESALPPNWQTKASSWRTGD